MANDLERAKDDERHSGFPAHEGSSFCSRPTPVVPANPELCNEGESNADAPARPSLSSMRPSDRPTYVPDDYIEPRLESPPTVTIDGPTPLESSAEDAPAADSRAPLAARVSDRVTAPVLSPSPPAKPRSRRGRVAFARVLFVVLFGAVGLLLGYAFKPRVAGALERMRGAGPAATVVK